MQYVFENRKRNLIKIRLYPLDVVYFLLMFSQLRLPFVNMMSPLLDTVYDVLNLISTCLIFTFALASKVFKNPTFQRNSTILIWVAMYSILIFFSTILNRSDIWSGFKELLGWIAVLLLIEMMIQKDPIKCFNVILACTGIWVYANFVSMLIYPKGLYNVTTSGNAHWLLGQKNNIISYVLPFIGTELCKSAYRYGNIRFSLSLCINTFICCASVIIANSSTSLVAIVVFGLLCMLVFIFKLKIVVRPYLYIILGILATILIVFFQYQNAFSSIIIGILGKDLSFTGRTIVWQKCLRWISEQPICGYGIETSEVVTEKLWQGHAHNQYLWILYRGGFVSAILFVGILFSVGKHLRMYMQFDITKILIIWIGCIFLTWQMDVYDSYVLWAPFVFGSAISALVKKN